MILSFNNTEEVRKIDYPNSWFQREWRKSCSMAYTNYMAVENLATKAKNVGFSKKEVFQHIKNNYCQYSSDKSIWSAIYKGWKK